MIRSTAKLRHDHDHQQHERGRVGLLRRVALAGRRVVVDVAGQRRAGAAQRVERPERAAGALQLQRSRRAGSRRSRCRRRCGPCRARCRSRCRAAPPAAARAGSSRPSSCRARRRPRARGAGSPAATRASRPTISGSAISDIIAPAVEERAAEHRTALGRERQEARRCRSRRRSGRRSRARCSACPAITSTPDSTARASQNGRPYSRQPDRGRDAERHGHHRADHGQQERARAAGRGSRRPCSGRGRRCGWLNSSSGRRNWSPLHEHVDHDRPGDHAEADAGDPAQRQPDAVDQRPGRSSRERLARAASERRVRAAST